jgi:hypothetical protein
MRTTVALPTVVVALLSVSPVARAQTIDQPFRADLERLMTVTGAADVGMQLAAAVTDSILKQMQARTPEVPLRMLDVAKEVLTSEFAKMMQGPDSIMPKLIAVYAKHFTHDDVKGLLAFYDTPIGRKSVKVMPTLALEGVAVGEAWAQANMPRMLETLEKRLRAEGFN